MEKDESPYALLALIFAKMLEPQGKLYGVAISVLTWTEHVVSVITAALVPSHSKV